ncbi:MAG: DinB family protein [Cytophagales bacterium]|nr:MAG: DinB family protein [Cytophagales bacterium]TAF61532.1 MAG: DinB family protein [Cytophagales bacterium]
MTTQKEHLKILAQEIAQGLELVKTTLQTQDMTQLNHKAYPQSWSALECLEHLNRYARYYLPELRRTITESTFLETDHIQVKHGFLGNYFTKTVSETNPKSKNKTLKHLNPVLTGVSPLDYTSLDEFCTHQEEFLKLLQQAATKDINAKTVRVEFIKWLKIRISDALVFVIKHQTRHIHQAIRAIKASK